MTDNTNSVSIIKVNGMKCHNCVSRVEKAIRSLDGVYGVAIDLAAKTATVTYDETNISPANIAGAIGDLGYDCVIDNRKFNLS
jgi:Copper chaperone